MLALLTIAGASLWAILVGYAFSDSELPIPEDKAHDRRL